MSYWLGIDVGTTFTAAAIYRDEVGRRAFPEVVPLGSRFAAVSSVVYLGEDGQVVVGEAAERRAVTDPGRVIREFKRRIGDEVPMVIGGVPHSAPEIAALVVRWVVDRVAEREDEPAQGITITHPASWGAYKIRVMRDALGAADLPEIRFCTEPEAAAASYSVQERIEVGTTIAVYDLGGGTFDAAIVRKTGTATFSVLGLPEGIDRLGGVDFDDAVFRHVVTAVPALGELDPEAPATLAATARLRRECTEAKEALSADTEVTIPVLLPGVQSEVRLVRAEFEDLIRPQVVETVEALRRALRSAGIGPEDLDTVLLVGGSSRVPLVAQLISAELGRPVAVDADPKAAIALGAARFGLPADTDHPAAAGTVPLAAPAPAVVEATSAAGLAGSGSLDAASENPAPEPVPVAVTVAIPHRPSMSATLLEVEPVEVEWRRARSRRIKQLTAAGLLALVLVGGAASVPLLAAHRGSSPPVDAGEPAPALPATTTTPAQNVEPGGGSSPPIEDSGGSGDGLAADSVGAVRMTPSATPSTAAGAVANPDPPPAPAPPTTWTTTHTWTTRWSNPPASTTNSSPQPTNTTMPPAPTTTPPPRTATTTVAPPPTTARPTTAPPTAVPATAAPPTTNPATTRTAPDRERSNR